MKNLIKFLFLPLFLLFSFAGMSASDMHGLEDELIKISEKAKKSVASIKVEITEQQRMRDPFFDFFFGNPMQPRSRKSQAQGSGFVIDDKEGFIVTNNHVVQKAEKIEVMIDGKTFSAKLIGTDPHTDVGLIKIEEFKTNGLNKEDFERIKKMIYGEYIKGYNDAQDIARMFLSDFMKGINSFDYIDEMEIVNLEFANEILRENFEERKTVLSVVK